jgi:hypothetical protein
MAHDPDRNEGTVAEAVLFSPLEKKLVIAGDRWKQKYQNEILVNKELGARVQAWKAKYNDEAKAHAAAVAETQLWRDTYYDAIRNPVNIKLGHAVQRYKSRFSDQAKRVAELEAEVAQLRAATGGAATFSDAAPGDTSARAQAAMTAIMVGSNGHADEEKPPEVEAPGGGSASARRRAKAESKEDENGEGKEDDEAKEVDRAPRAHKELGAKKHEEEEEDEEEQEEEQGGEEDEEEEDLEEEEVGDEILHDDRNETMGLLVKSLRAESLLFQTHGGNAWMQRPPGGAALQCRLFERLLVVGVAEGRASEVLAEEAERARGGGGGMVDGNSQLAATGERPLQKGSWLSKFKIKVLSSTARTARPPLTRHPHATSPRLTLVPTLV